MCEGPCRVNAAADWPSPCPKRTAASARYRSRLHWLTLSASGFEPFRRGPLAVVSRPRIMNPVTPDDLAARSSHRGQGPPVILPMTRRAGVRSAGASRAILVRLSRGTREGAPGHCCPRGGGWWQGARRRQRPESCYWRRSRLLQAHPLAGADHGDVAQHVAVVAALVAGGAVAGKLGT